jgi:hypothetical protein
MSFGDVVCLLTHKCNELSHTLGAVIAELLKSSNIALLIDPFRLGDDVQTRERTFQFEALLFFCTPESRASQNCQLEIETARKRRVPIFTALLDGPPPEELRSKINWTPHSAGTTEFLAEIALLATSIKERAFLLRRVNAIQSDAPPDETRDAAQSIAMEMDRTVIAEYASALADRYVQIKDPTTRYWLALSLGRASTPQAEEILRRLPDNDHPYALEGVREALAMIQEFRT